MGDMRSSKPVPKLIARALAVICLLLLVACNLLQKPTTSTTGCIPISSPPTLNSGTNASNVSLPKGAIRRIHIDGGHGDHGFFVHAQHVCTKGLDFYSGPLVYHDNSPGAQRRLNQSLPLLWPFGSSNHHHPVQLGFSFQFVEIEKNPIAVPEACYFPGNTVVIENSVGAPGHIGHFSETTAKFFAWVDQYIGHDTINTVWATGIGLFPKSDWERHFAAASIGLSKDQKLPRTLDSTKAMAIAAKNDCQRLCFENTYWSQVVQQWHMSRSSADIVRERSWQYCGITPRDTNLSHANERGFKVLGYRPTFLYLPRFTTRVIENSEEILSWAQDAGFQVLPVAKNLTDFCAQVALLESADVVLSMHSSALVNTMFMHPNTVVIEATSRNFYWPCFKIIALHARLTYLDWTNKHAHLQMNRTDEPKNDNIRMSDDIKAYLSFARDVVGTEYWSTQECNSINKKVDVYTEYNFQRCLPIAKTQPS